MALENVLTSIKEQGRRDAEKEVAAARREADALVAAARDEAAALVTRRREDGVHAADLLKRREMASAELDSKKLRLAAERDVLLRIRAEVEARLTKLPAAERERHIQSLVKKANVKDGKVRVREEDAAAAKAAGVATAGTFRGLGGVLVESADGATTEDLRYENLLDEVWRESLNDVAQIVFKGSGK